VTTTARTARIAHACDTCRWTPSLRETPTIAAGPTAQRREDHQDQSRPQRVPTIVPGHRYLRHVAFPEGPMGEINQSSHLIVITECVACACEREVTAGLLIAGACATFCCGDVPCALPFGHRGDDHSCRRCLRTSSATRNT
jgi:hypothetical protein